MAHVKVRLFANIREIVGERELFLNSTTVNGVLDTLTSMKPDLQDVLFEDGALRPYITVLLNGRNINEIDGIKSVLSEGDEVAIFPPVSGG
jgi:molybdopterin synthase sulfur carrier subunit